MTGRSAAVYSIGIQAAVEYVGEAHGAQPDADERRQPIAQLDPHETIKVFYAPAMRRIHRGIKRSDPSTQARCRGLELLLSIDSSADEMGPMLFALQVEGESARTVRRHWSVRHRGLRFGPFPLTEASPARCSTPRLR